MRKISSKIVPQILRDDQKQHRLHISSDLLYNAEMFARVITSDETYDPEKKTPQHAVENTEFTSAERSMHVLLAVQAILVCFFNHTGVIHYEFIARGQMVNQQCYLEVLTRL
jgi:hypothetical protein